MSWRERIADIDSTVDVGDNVMLFRDNDTKSYRLFVHTGKTPVTVGTHTAYQFKSSENCDLSFDDLKALARALADAVANHSDWPIDEDGD